MCRLKVGRARVLVYCLALVPLSESCGEVLTFDYTGSVLSDATIFGFDIDASDPVAGRLIVDPAAPMTHDFGGGRLGYRQIIPTGLRASFGSGSSAVEFVANEYLVVIADDFEGLFGRVDVVEFLFSTDLLPALAQPLVVNGASRTQGDFNQDGAVDELDYGRWRTQIGMAGGSADGNGDGIVDAADYVIWRAARPIGLLSFEFHGPDSLFSSSSLTNANLASNFNATNFTSPFNLVGDGTSLSFFDVTTLSLATPAAVQVPEPCGLRVLIALASVFVCYRRHTMWPAKHASILRAT
jgi:hypothetical protein